MSEWRPIETAPKNGIIILVLEPAALSGRTRYGRVTTVAWAPDGRYVEGGFWDDGSFVAKPTHWMPLPEPPK